MALSYYFGLYNIMLYYIMLAYTTACTTVQAVIAICLTLNTDHHRADERTCGAARSQASTDSDMNTTR